MSNKVAETILQQLGGKNFVVMTGAKNFAASEDALHFSLPGSMCKYRINRCVIKLVGDNYTMTFYRLWGSDLKQIVEYEGLFFDQLTELFREATGLETRMPRIYRS